MRILHVNKFLYRRGGAEAYLFDTAALQARAGHDIEFFGMSHGDNGPYTFSAWFPREITLEPPPHNPRERAAAVVRMIYSQESRHGMEQVLARYRPDVVHLHNIYHQLSPSILGPIRKAGVPAVMTLHDYKLACPSYQLLDHGRLCDACVTKGLHHAALRRCKDGSLMASTALAAESWLHRATRAYDPVGVFVSPSEFLRSTMVRAGVFPDRIVVVRHFVETEQHPRKQEPGGDLVFAGRLSPEKGVDVLLDAVARLSSEARLHVLGDGPQRSQLEQVARERLGGRVIFHGRVDKPAVLDAIRSASAVVVPSRWHENQPMIVLEAFACGVPVVTTSLGGLRELVTPDVDGFVVPPNDPDQLAEALRGVLADPERAFLMGMNARRKAEQLFNPQRHLEELSACYRAAARRLGSDIATAV